MGPAGAGRTEYNGITPVGWVCWVMGMFRREPRIAAAGLLLSIATIIGCSSDATAPAPAPTGLRLAPVDSGYDFSVFVTAPPGDTSRLFVVERGGRIRLRQHGVRQDSAFLNLSALTNPASGEYGVYSLAFHPQYATNRRLFVYYAGLDGTATLAEFTADSSGNHADPASQQILLTQAEAAPAVLYGGLVTFGPDGKLYLGLGDGQTGGDPLSRAQDSTSLLGKILRLDVDAGSPYVIPADNPYVGRPGWRGEIWQLGLRNPWRWSFDRGTGDLYIGDVGEAFWEEIDYLADPVVGGNNFGWPITEGVNCYQPAIGCFTLGLVPPVIVYAHGRSCAVTGGYVYRGTRSPILAGTYFYGDFCGGWVRNLTIEDGYPAQNFGELELPPVRGIGDNVVSFGQDAAGEVYVVSAAGRIYRIVDNDSVTPGGGGGAASR